jgi:hypothetical protein
MKQVCETDYISHLLLSIVQVSLIVIVMKAEMVNLGCRKKIREPWTP